jgi:conjugative relaxase-like TrwC/TraI family protein
MNTTRWENEKHEPNRRIFYDFTISPPKSVSVVALYQDKQIVELHNRAVRVAMDELEGFAGTRVRKSKQDSERATGNIVTACFRHDTSRELDPHLHTHCVVFNATFDSVENRWKALEVSGMYRAQKFAENLYYHELSKGLRTLGYEIENNPRGFEIKGVPASVIDRFSKRHRQIDEETTRQIERDGSVGNIAALREHIAHTGRKRKQMNSTAERLRPDWREQMPPEERQALDRLRDRPAKILARADLPGIVTWADSQVFERRAVAGDYELMSAALARGRGEDFGLEALRAEVGRRSYFREEGSRRLTSRETLKRELAVVVAAHDGQRMHHPLNPDYRPAEALSGEQRTAVDQILQSTDFITLFRGAAGTGKSFTLREVVNGLRAAGRPVAAVAPQRQQAADLAENGIEATTLAHCLELKAVPPRAVVLVDEAGQVGGKQFAELTALVQARGGRLILSGDIRQHGPVEASDILRAIERKAGLKPAVLREIRRQNPALAKSRVEKTFISGYRRAVKAASDGRVEDSFDQLDRLGCVREVPADSRRDQLAAEYLASLDRKESPLVVAQTWNEVTAVNDSIRAALRERGAIGQGAAIKTLHAVDLTNAEKQDARFYRPGQVAYFQKRYGRYAKRDCCPVVGTNERGVVLEKDGRRSTLSFKYAGRLVLAEERELEIASGDRLQLKFNGKSLDGQPLSNGELVTVRHVRADGALEVEDARGRRKTLSAKQRLFNRGYSVTSYGSQGKTVDTVLFADSGCHAATSAEQWYVTISRGRKRVTIFTQDKAALRAAVARQGGKDLSLDLLPRSAEAEAHNERNALAQLEQLRRHRLVMAQNPGNRANIRIAL